MDPGVKCDGFEIENSSIADAVQPVASDMAELTAKWSSPVTAPWGKMFAPSANLSDDSMGMIVSRAARAPIAPTKKPKQYLFPRLFDDSCHAASFTAFFISRSVSQSKAAGVEHYSFHYIACPNIALKADR